jgi:iron complex outermembrane recepter protein
MPASEQAQRFLATILILGGAVLASSGLALAQDTDVPDDALAPEAPPEAPLDEAPPAETPLEEPAEPPAVDAELIEAAEVPETPTDSPEGEDIVITGSRLKRTSFDAPSPVQVVDRAALAKSGAANMRDVVASIPANYGAENNAGIGTGARGTSQFNLHGLGPGATLVLLNGRRLIRTGLTAEGQPFDDVTQIPLPLVERVEVMKGGASAIYGSDAVAGVVNIITRRKYNGVEVQLGGNLSTRPGNLRDGEVALTLGSASDDSGIGVTVTYYNRSELLGDDRDYSLGEPNLPAWDFNTPVPATGLQRGVYQRPTNLSQQGNPASFVFEIPGMMAPGMTTPPPPTYVTAPDPLCLSPAARAAGSYQQGNNCGFDFTEYYNYVYPEERINVYSTMEHDFSDHLQGFAEIGYFRQSIENPLSPSYSLSKGLYVPKDYPMIPAELQANADMANSIRISGRTRGGDYPPMRDETRVDTFRLVAGLKGDFGDATTGTAFEDWDWELSATYQDYRWLDRASDDIAENLQRSLDACGPSSPDHASQNDGVQQVPCFHPFYAERPLNLSDRDNALGQNAIEYIQGKIISQSDVSMVVGDALLRGSIAKLPGGDLGFAVGAQARHNSIEWNADRDAQLQRYVFIIGTPGYEASNNIFAGYGELGVPILRGLEVQGALRFEHYSDVGSSTTPKVGLSYIPFVGSSSKALSGIRIRGAYAGSFRGPSLFQTAGKQVQLSQFTVGTSQVFRPQTTIGNPNLDPETSTAINAGLEWDFGGFTFSGEYWRFTYEDLVVKENGPAKWTACQAKINAMPGVPAGTVAAANPAECADVQLSDDGQLQGVNVAFENASAVTTHGIDLGGQMRFGNVAEGLGMLSIGAQASFLFAYVTQADAMALKVERAGKRNFSNFAPSLPKLHMQIPVGWGLGGHYVQATGKLIGSYLNEDDPDIDYSMPVPKAIPNTGAEIPAWFTLDLQYSFRTKDLIGKSSSFTLGATNLLDADPPWVYTNLGYDGTQHDARGRLLYARITQEF